MSITNSIIHNLISFVYRNQGASLCCTRMVRWNKGNTFRRRILRSKIRKIVAAKKRGREFIFPAPLFLPAPPEGKALIKIRSPDFCQRKFGF